MTKIKWTSMMWAKMIKLLNQRDRLYKNENKEALVNILYMF